MPTAPVVARPSVLPQDADVHGDVDQWLLREVGKFLGTQALPLLDVEPQQLPPQRVAEEKEEGLLGIFDLRRHG
jgi:hypothetical protein